MKTLFRLLLILAFAAAPFAARAGDGFVVRPVPIEDEKAVFATVESMNVVPARARIGGTVADLAVKDGDRVEQGQVVAVVGDEKIAVRIEGVNSRIAAAEAELTRAKTDLDRLKALVPKGAAAASALDSAQRDYNVALNSQKAAATERDVLRKQISEGQVLAPVAGRILKVPVTAGTVVMPGETLATVAEGNYILRLEVPERHARFLKAGNPVRLDRPELAGTPSATGKITLIYPQIENGRVIADAAVEGLDDYFVGQRVRVWISAGERTGFIVPPEYLAVRYGVDYARIGTESGAAMDVPVQRGRVTPGGIEILSGLRDGDTLVRP